jgi:hypothetical protein
VKRSRSIRLVLIGGLSAGALSGCGPDRPPPLTSEAVYTNDFSVPGVGYYHAPFRAWYPLPYNHFDPKTQRYFFGGQWSETPFQSITNISAPTPLIAEQAEAMRTDIARGGFGSTAGAFFIHS